jgi:chorismate dehydratase
MLQAKQQVLRLGVVNFLNATPLIDGIASIQGIELVPKVPSELVGCLEQNDVDIALASSIDYQRSNSELSIMPEGVLSSRGETLTVRLCSKSPLASITEVHCDTDSHTSVALLQIILNNEFGITPTITSCDVRELHESNDWPDTVLMIGDKVVTSATESVYPLQLDLGEAWYAQTKLPFVFAMWFGKSSLHKELVHRASMVLDRQRRCNANRIEQVVSDYACPKGWDTKLAYRYLTKHIEYSFTEKHRESLELFFAQAHSLRLLDKVKPLIFFEQ